jgi:hypothetical protein
VRLELAAHGRHGADGGSGAMDSSLAQAYIADREHICWRAY